MLGFTSQSKNFSPLSLQFICGVLSGLWDRPSSYVTMSQWLLHGRYLHLLAICHSFTFTAISFQVEPNPVVDATSWFQFACFTQQAPVADQVPVMILALILTSLQITWWKGASSPLPKAKNCLRVRVYLSAQLHYINFCQQDGHLSLDGSFPPADEETLMHFSILLVDSLNHSQLRSTSLQCALVTLTTAYLIHWSVFSYSVYWQA